MIVFQWWVKRTINLNFHTHTTWTPQYVIEEILFFRLLEGLISGQYI